MRLRVLAPNKLTIDFFITLLTSILTVLGILFINAYIARAHGLEVLGEYSLIWRLITALVGVFLMGLNISIPYFLPKGNENSIVNSAFIILQIFTIPLLILLAYVVSLGLVPGFKSNNAYAYFIFALGIIFKSIIYSYFRGNIKMVMANILQFVTILFIPVIAVLVFQELSHIFYFIGYSMILFTIVFFLYHRKTVPKYNFKYKDIKNIFSFGINRLLGIIGESFLLAGIPVLLASSISFSNLAYINSSMSVIRIFLVIIGPIGIILLPRISKALDMNRIQEIRQGLEILIKVSIVFGATAGIFFVLFGNDLLDLWLGSVHVEELQYINYIFISIPFFIIFKLLNSPINAISTRGYISIIYLFTAIILVGTYHSLINIGLTFINAGILSIIISYFTASSLSLLLIKFKLDIKIFNLLTIKNLLVINFVQIIIYTVEIQLLDSLILELIIHLTFLIVFIIIFFKYSSSLWITEIKHLLTKN